MKYLSRSVNNKHSYSADTLCKEKLSHLISFIYFIFIKLYFNASTEDFVSLIVGGMMIHQRFPSSSE